MKKSILFIVIIAVIGLIGFEIIKSRSSKETASASNGKVATATTGSSTVPKSKPLPAVRVEKVIPETLSITMTLTGEVAPTRTARLASPGEGPVEACATTNCLVREGDEVKQGQVLIQISRNKSAQAQLAAAKQTLKEQETELQRIRQLVEAGAVPGAQLDTARSKYENARAQLAKAEESAGDYLIKAPWTGIVSKVFVTEGDYVAPRAPLVEIFDPASLVVRFSVPETRSTDVREGLTVDVKLDAHQGKTYKGKISRAYPGLNEKTRTRTVEATLINPPALLPGMFVRIQVLLEKIPEAIMVPVNSIITTPEGDSEVFVLEDEKAVKRKLVIGREIEGHVLVLSGLKSGDRVIVAGQEKLKNGASVRAEPAESGNLPPMKENGGSLS